MNQFLNTLDTLFLSPAGSMMFHLLIMITIVICYQLVISHKNHRKINIRKKFLIGLGVIAALEFMLFILTAVVQTGLLDGHLYLPIINRYFMTVMVLTLVWLWISSSETKVFNLLYAFVNAILFLVFVFSLWAWIDQPEQQFSQTNLDWIWGFINVGILIAGLFVLPMQRSPNWQTGFAVLITNLAGQLIHIFIYNNTPTDVSSVLRLFLLLAFPFLPTLIVERLAGGTSATDNPRVKTYANFFNKKIKLLTDGNPNSFKKQIPLLIKELSLANEAFIIASDKIHSEITFTSTGENQETPIRIHRERIPELMHANEGQFILSFENIPAFRDEFKRIAPNLMVNTQDQAIALPYPVQPESTTSILLVYGQDVILDEVKQSEVSNMIGSLLLLLHQKQREEQLQGSIDRLIENNQNRLRPLTSVNFQLLQQEHGELQDKYEILTQEKDALLQDVADLSAILETEAGDMGRHQTAKAFEILNNWLARAQTENGILQSRLAQVDTERESLQFELEHFRENRHLSERHAYLQPQESLPLDDKTRLNETLARAKEFLFTISELNEIVEQNQIQSVVLMESIQEQIANIHNLHDDMEEEASFIIQAEYFLEDIRTAQSALRELVKLQRLLEDTFNNAMKMKDKFDHLTNINQHNYIQINEIFTEIETDRTKTKETDQILQTVQTENENLRKNMIQAIDQNKGDSLAIENLQSELITALEEINILRDRIEQDQEKLLAYQLSEEMTTNGIRENNQIIISLLQDLLQPISDIGSSTSLLFNQYSDNNAVIELTDRIFSSINSIQDQISKLLSSTDRNLQLVTGPENLDPNLPRHPAEKVTK